MTIKSKEKDISVVALLQRIISGTINRTVLFLMRRLPIRYNYIVLRSEGDFTDNIRTFYDYLISNHYNEQFKLIWLVKDPKQYPKQRNVVFCPYCVRGIHCRANYYIGVSRFLVYSHAGWIKNWRKEQIAIHTTHSASQVKKVCWDTVPGADYVIACSESIADYRYKVFCLPRNHMLILGMPRTDLIYHHKECLPMLIPGYQGQKVILSMPTMKKAINWNDSTNTEDYVINVVHSKEDFMHLDGFLKQIDYYMIIKLHHLQDLSAIQKANCERIIYLNDGQLSRYDVQVNELLENADILLTDYSSVFFEYLLLDRPIGFLVGDIEDYKRGFEDGNPLDQMPGEKLRSLSELKSFLIDVKNGIDPYVEFRRKIKEEVFKFDDDHNSERLIMWMISQNEQEELVRDKKYWEAKRKV